MIRAQEETIRLLSEAQSQIQTTEAPVADEAAARTMEKLEKENISLRNELKVSLEKEQTLRQFVIISWVGFTCVVATLVHGLR